MEISSGKDKRPWTQKINKRRETNQDREIILNGDEAEVGRKDLTGEKQTIEQKEEKKVEKL